MTRQVQICIIIVTAAGPKINIDSIERYIMQGRGRVYTVYTKL